MTKIKICGLTRSEDIDAVNQYRPDYIGFVFAAKSSRFVTPAQAAGLKKRLSQDIEAVGVFADEDKKIIVDLINRGVIDMAQLHGRESEEDIRWIQERAGRPVIKAVSVKSRTDLVRAADSCAEYLLFDHGGGGTGKAFDWNLLTDCAKPFFLAGGIHIQNLADAVSRGAYAIDISSGVEINGRKDANKIKDVINKIRT